MKKKLLLSIAFACLLAAGTVVFSSENTYAENDCNDAKGHLKVESDYIDSPAELGGGDDYGVSWACGRWSTNSAIMLFARKVEISDGVYTVYPDVKMSSDQYTTVKLYGMVHFHEKGTSAQYASHIGFCLKKGDCARNGNNTGDASINTSADGADADGLIVKPFSSSLQRAGSGNPREEANDYWALPYYESSIKIDNDKLLEMIENYEDYGLEISPGLKNGGTKGTVKIYIHKCYSTDGSGVNGTCEEGSAYLVVKLTPRKTTFDHTITASSGSCIGTCWIDSASTTVKFEHEMKRNGDGPDGEVSNNWWAFYDKEKDEVSSTSQANTSGSKSIAKTTTDYVSTYTHDNVTVELAEGGTARKCEADWIYTEVDGKGNANTDTKSVKSDCVTIKRYKWYNMYGQVLASSTNAKKDDSDGYYYTDKNTADIKFDHQVKTNSPNDVNPKIKTGKNPNPGEAFTTIDSYTKLTATVKKSEDWKTVYSSPSSAATVPVAKDDGSVYKQPLYYYSKVRQDSEDYKEPTSVEGEIKLKRYKTTFTGRIEIHVNSDKVTDDDGKKISSEANIAGKTIHVSDDKYPSGIPITFEHFVKRSGSDAHGSPSGKSSAIKTTITKHDDVRDGDDYGTEITDIIGPLDAGAESSKTDTFTVQVYPEHNIVLCQKLTYTSEIQGEEATASATTDDACVTIVMEHADCLGNKTFGIKNGKNWLKAEIYKNNSETATKATEALYEGSTNSLVEWAKPGDQIRYKYYGCAGGELARQYQNADAHTTTYSISTDKAGYLFGRTVGKDAAGTYNALSTTIGSSSSTDGTGPFNDSFTITVGSPSGDGETEAEMLYSCGAHGNNAIKNFYRIPNYIAGVSAADYRDKCSSDDSGRVDDLGSTITQFASWTDIQYSGGSVYNGHDGSVTAKVTAQVKVPYNYRTGIRNSGTGGDIFPGTKHTEHVMLDVVQRTNSLVNGTSEYATATKPSNYRLIQIKIGPEYDGSSTDFNNTINANGVDDTYGGTYFDDDDGSKNLAAELPICQSFNCEIKVSGNNTQFGDKYNGSSERSIGSYTLEVPYDTKPGTKFCYISAIWPSDSHNDQDLEDIDAAANEIALKTGKVEGSKWHLSGASCFTTAKRPSISVLGGDTYAQRYITSKAIKYPQGENGANPRIYSSWAEYGLIAGDSIQGFASGASLWGGSNNVSNKPNASVNCIFSALTYANSGCKDGNLGSLSIDTNASSSPKNLTDQIRTRYTRDSGEAYSISRSGDTIAIGNSGTCVYNGSKFVKDPEDGSFDCIGDTGAKYTHIATKTSQTASIQSTFCLSKGSEDDNHASIIHADGTLVIGANVIYGTGSDCTPESYADLNEIPQYIFVANKIVIKQDVTHIDGWLVANEIITCDPSGEDDWAGTVAQSEINSKNCNQQLTINGPVMAKSLKLYRTFGGGYDDSANLASPAEIFKLGPESYMWAYGQASRYSQATTTYSRELAPRY